MKEKKYIVLGGNGFIGRNLCAYIKKRGKSITSFDCVLPETCEDGIIYVQGDFFHDEFLYSLIQEYDVIIHAISTINPGNSNERYMNGYERDFVQTVKMCSWIKDTDKKVVFLSSGGTVYGDHKVQPLDETIMPCPINHYGNVKLCIENALRIFHVQNRLSVSIARISNPYGPGQDFRKGVGFVDAVLKQSMDGNEVEIWGDGENIRDYIYIDDVCEFLYKLADYQGEELLFNVSSGKGVTQNYVVQKIRDLGLCVNVNYKEQRSVDVRRLVLNNAKAQEICHVKITSFEDGIKKYYDYLQEIS